MENTTQNNNSLPARMHFAAGLLLVGMAGVLVFCGLLYLTHSRPAKFDVGGYGTAVPQEVDWDLTAAVQEGELRVEGWALELGRYVEKVDIQVLLYHAASDTYLRLPTAMVLDEDLGAQFEDGPKNYPYGGFVGRTAVKHLAHAPQEYEVCLAFSHNQLDVLIHTGEAAA